MKTQNIFIISDSSGATAQTIAHYGSGCMRTFYFLVYDEKRKIPKTHLRQTHCDY